MTFGKYNGSDLSHYNELKRAAREAGFTSIEACVEYRMLPGALSDDNIQKVISEAVADRCNIDQAILNFL